jgi:XRE family transcriptional regulator, fatty acid utilization regulator
MNRRNYAGRELRRLRDRLGLTQGQMAARLGLSVSYLSQLENDARPISRIVAERLAAEFPRDWYGGDATIEARRLAALGETLADPIFAALPELERPGRVAEQQPELVDRLVTLHAAWRQAEEARQIVDDALSAGEGMRQPWEEVRDWFHVAENYVDQIDRAAELLSHSLDTSEVGLTSWMVARHGVRVEAAEGDQPPLRRFDRKSGQLMIDQGQPPESRRFQLAHQIASLELSELITEVATSAREVGSEVARQVLWVGLLNYAAGALLMPYERFRRAARETRHDIDRLRQQFSVSFEQACHRLSTLQRPGARGIPFFFCRVDKAGNITKRHSATRLQFARFGGTCPLWMVHEAVAVPDQILAQLVETSDGVRYVSMAKGLVKSRSNYMQTPRRYAVALGCEAEHARDFIYADGLDLARPGGATPIGVSCRLCPRETCDQRAFPPSDRAITVDPDVRAIVPYKLA